MRSALLSACVVLGVLVLAFPANASVYTGSLIYTPAGGDTDGLIVSGETWAFRTVTIAWTVTNADTTYAGFPWKYTYHFQEVVPTGPGVKEHGVSHVIIEISEKATEADFTGWTGGAELDSLGPQKANSGNPSMPEDIFGIKFNPVPSSPSDMTWSFWSTRAPVWGDFYVKDGANDPVNTAYNAGFADPDPSDPPLLNGSVDYHILRPDSATTPIGDVPEPSTFLIWALLGALAAAVRWGQKRAG